MTSMSRRLFLEGAGGLLWATAGLGFYAFAFEPALRLNVTSYRITPPGWPDGLTVRAAVLADIHSVKLLFSAIQGRFKPYKTVT
jgi:uncharacterized protein